MEPEAHLNEIHLICEEIRPKLRPSHETATLPSCLTSFLRAKAFISGNGSGGGSKIPPMQTITVDGRIDPCLFVALAFLSTTRVIGEFI